MNFVTREQMQQVDQLAVSKYDVPLIDMMEKAGRYLADVVMMHEPQNVVICYGSGNNAGGGLVAARYLLDRLPSVSIVSPNENLKEVATFQLERLRMLGIKQDKKVKGNKKTVIIDALLGYGITDNPSHEYSKIIKQINAAKVNHGAKVISLDIPSGLDPTTGELYSPHVIADQTVALALPKEGFKKQPKIIGELYVANIGVPMEVYKELGLSPEPLFEHGDIEKITI